MLAHSFTSMFEGGFKAGVAAPPSLELLQPANASCPPNAPNHKELPNRTRFTRMPRAYANSAENSPMRGRARIEHWCYSALGQQQLTRMARETDSEAHGVARVDLAQSTKTNATVELMAMRIEPEWAEVARFGQGASHALTTLQ